MPFGSLVIPFALPLERVVALVTKELVRGRKSKQNMLTAAMVEYKAISLFLIIKSGCSKK
jgi:hypothetical protein